MNEAREYHLITESPGLKATQEQLARIYHRYRFALEFAENKDILEIACGCGMGLEFLAKKAKRVVGGDIDRKNVRTACELYQGTSVECQEMDAHALPLEESCFDLVLLLEAIYYLEFPDKFVKEAKRILRPGGILFICTVNREWIDFHPSPYTHRYFSASELSELLKNDFDHVDFYGAFSTYTHGITRLTSLLKRMAVKINLIPGSLAARTWLKRIFIGQLTPLPAKVYENMAPYEPPVPILPLPNHRDFKILYAVAYKAKINLVGKPPCPSKNAGWDN